MELEQRIQALEQEVQLLKSQIQATLLDIQEQLLTNAYPALRAEDTPLANGQAALPAFARPQPNTEIPGTAYESPTVRRISFNEPTVAEPSDKGRDLPIVRKVSSRHLEDDEPEEETVKPVAVRKVSPEGQKKSKSANGAHSRRVEPDTEPQQAANDGVIGELEKWTLNRLEKYGSRRTRDLIHTYVEEGRMDETVRDTLFAILAQYDEDAPPRPPQDDWDDEYPAVSSKPQREATLRIVPETKVTLKARPTVEEVDSDDVRATLDETTARGLVTRLISGVRNAGSTKRNHKHG